MGLGYNIPVIWNINSSKQTRDQEATELWDFDY